MELRRVPGMEGPSSVAHSSTASLGADYGGGDCVGGRLGGSGPEPSVAANREDGVQAVLRISASPVRT